MSQMQWGELPYFYGPFHYFKESLILTQVKRYLNKGMRILDAGCGSGSLAIKLAKLGYKVQVVDVSTQFIDFVKSRVEKLGLSYKISIEHGDITKLPFADSTFTAVCSNDVLEHLENDQKAIRELQRVLKKRGFCFICVPVSQKLWSKLDVWAGHKRRYEKGQLEKLFEGSGFVIKESHYYGGELSRFWLNKIYWPLVSKQPNKGKKKMIFETLPRIFLQNDLVLRILSLPFKIDDHLSIKKIGLILVAQKK